MNDLDLTGPRFTVEVGQRMAGKEQYVIRSLEQTDDRNTAERHCRLANRAAFLRDMLQEATHTGPLRPEQLDSFRQRAADLLRYIECGTAADSEGR